MCFLGSFIQIHADFNKTLTVLPVFPPFRQTTAKEIKVSTLLMFCPEDIKYELE